MSKTNKRRKEAKTESSDDETYSEFERTSPESSDDEGSESAETSEVDEDENMEKRIEEEEVQAMEEFEEAVMAGAAEEEIVAPLNVAGAQEEHDDADIDDVEMTTPRVNPTKLTMKQKKSRERIRVKRELEEAKTNSPIVYKSGWKKIIASITLPDGNLAPLNWKEDRSVKHRFNLPFAPQRTPGIRFNVTTAGDAFLQMFSQEARDMMLRNTNISGRKGRGDSWKDVSEEEFILWWSCLTYIWANPRRDIKTYWSKRISTFIVSPMRFMHRRRYENINRWITVSDTEAAAETGASDRSSSNFSPMWRIEPFLRLLSKAWRGAVDPDEWLSIDEVMVGCKGRAPSKVRSF